MYTVHFFKQIMDKTITLSGLFLHNIVNALWQLSIFFYFNLQFTIIIILKKALCVLWGIVNAQNM